MRPFVLSPCLLSILCLCLIFQAVLPLPHSSLSPMLPRTPSRTVCPNELFPLLLVTVGPCMSTTSAASCPLLSPLPTSQLFTPAFCSTLGSALPPESLVSFTYYTDTDCSASFLSPQNCWSGSGSSISWRNS